MQKQIKLKTQKEVRTDKEAKVGFDKLSVNKVNMKQFNEKFTVVKKKRGKIYQRVYLVYTPLQRIFACYGNLLK